MTYSQRIHAEWLKVFAEMSATPGFRRIHQGEITSQHYQSLMRQIFHHARENPQIQTLAAVYFRGQQRSMVKMFFKHATSEIGHDMLALDDLRTLGVDVTDIPTELPLPETTALLAYAFYQIQFRNPIGYLGYLYHLEYMPTTDGAVYLNSFRKAGVPDEAMTFIQDHATIDVAHNKMMQIYIEELVKTEQDFNAVVYALKVTAMLYGNMVTAAFNAVDAGLYSRVESGAVQPNADESPVWSAGLRDEVRPEL